MLHSQAKITLEGKAIRLGLTTNRKVPPYSAQEIVEKRGAKLWASFAQFRAAVNLDHKLLETLVLMGALDDLGERHQHLGELGLPARSALELVKAEKELLGVYVSLHPCGPFWPLAERLRGELDAAVGEVIELEMRGETVPGSAGYAWRVLGLPGAA